MKLFISLFILLVSLQATTQVVNDSVSTLMASKKLDAVMVLSKKPFIEQQIDKTVVYVQADIMAISSNAFEILQKATNQLNNDF